MEFLTYEHENILQISNSSRIFLVNYHQSEKQLKVKIGGITILLNSAVPWC